MTQNRKMSFAQRHLSKLSRAALSVATLLTAVAVSAQTPNGAGGLTSAAGEVTGYFAAGTQLMYAIGAVLGIVGAVKVYQKWSHGDPDTTKVASAWFGSCVFLIVVTTVLKAFFGV